MPAESQAQREFLNWKFGHGWVKEHHFDNPGKLPQYVHHQEGTSSVHGPAEYPPDHQPGMRVPKGGSSCSSCRYLSDDGRHCGNSYFQKWNGSDELPEPADEYCSDWYEPKEVLNAQEGMASVPSAGNMMTTANSPMRTYMAGAPIGSRIFRRITVFKVPKKKVPEVLGKLIGSQLSSSSSGTSTSRRMSRPARA